MITTGASVAILLLGVPIGMCLCIAAMIYIAATGNHLLFASFPMQLFGGVGQLRPHRHPALHPDRARS